MQGGIGAFDVYPVQPGAPAFQATSAAPIAHCEMPCRLRAVPGTYLFQSATEANDFSLFVLPPGGARYLLQSVDPQEYARGNRYFYAAMPFLGLGAIALYVGFVTTPAAAAGSAVGGLTNPVVVPFWIAGGVGLGSGALFLAIGLPLVFQGNALMFRHRPGMRFDLALNGARLTF